MFHLVRATLLVATFFVSSVGHADVIVLKNGDRFSGSILGFENGTLRVESPYSSALRIPASEISQIWTDGVVTLEFERGGYSTGRLSGDYAGGLLLVAGPSARQTVDLATIKRIHPGDTLPKGFRWSGGVNFGAEQQSGNTDSRSVHASAAIKGRSEEDRLTFRADFNHEFADGDRTEDNYTLFAQHDHFVSEQVYFYTNAKFHRDQPADLRLRTTVGTGGGWQVLENDRTSLSVEVGPAYTNEDLTAGADSDYLAGRWAVNFDQVLWTDVADLFHRHEGNVDLEDTSNVFIDSSTGVRFPLGNGFNATAQVDLDWDNQPPPDTSSLDKRYRLTLGYSW